MKGTYFDRGLRLRIAACALAVSAALTISGCANPVRDILRGATAPLASETSEASENSEETLDELTDASNGEFITVEIPDDFPENVPLPSGKPSAAVRNVNPDGTVTWVMHFRGKNQLSEAQAIARGLLANGYAEDANNLDNVAVPVAQYSNETYVVSLGVLGGHDVDKDHILQIMVLPTKEG